MNPDYPFQPQQPQPAQPTQQPYQPQQPVAPFQPQPTAGYGAAPGVTPPNLRPEPVKSSTKWPLIAFIFIFTTLATGGLAGWAFIEYTNAKADVDGQINNAVALAVKEAQADAASEYAEKEKLPTTTFSSPEEFGYFSFQYPKTWSVYEAQDANEGGDYEVYFNPGVIPPASDEQRYALRLLIQDSNYDEAVEEYSSYVTDGSLKSSAVTINGQTGTRLDGKFSDDIRGSAVILKIRDKTAIIRTDAETFKSDFNALIDTITFNK